MQLKVPEILKKELMPPTSIEELKQFILIRLPILSWLWSYKPKFLIGDITAGIAVSIMHIPQGEWFLYCNYKHKAVAIYMYQNSSTTLYIAAIAIYTYSLM